MLASADKSGSVLPCDCLWCCGVCDSAAATPGGARKRTTAQGGSRQGAGAQVRSLSLQSNRTARWPSARDQLACTPLLSRMCVLKWPASRFTWLVVYFDAALIILGTQSSPPDVPALVASACGLIGAVLVTCRESTSCNDWADEPSEHRGRRENKRVLAMTFLVVAMLCHAPWAAFSMQRISHVQDAARSACTALTKGSPAPHVRTLLLSMPSVDATAINSIAMRESAPLSKLLPWRRRMRRCIPNLTKAINSGSSLDLLLCRAVLTVITALLEAFCVMRVWKEDTERGRRCASWLWSEDDCHAASATPLDREFAEAEKLLEEARSCACSAPLPMVRPAW